VEQKPDTSSYQTAPDGVQRTDNRSRQINSRKGSSPYPAAEVPVVTDLPKQLPIPREELAIWRAYLAEEIDALLFGKE
jgi:hypothetical protein